MTTVLEALRELERRKGTAKQPVAASMERDRRIRWWWVTLAASVLVGGTIGLMLVLPEGDSPQLASIPAPGTVYEPLVEQENPPGVPRVASVRPARAPRWPRSVGRTDEAPWARLEKRPSRAPTRGRAAPLPARKAPPPMQKAAAPATQKAAPLRPAESRREPSKREVGSGPVVRGAEARGIYYLPSEPPVEVTAIAYTPDLAKRTVSLRIAGAGAVTLHEGESAGGVEVQLILRDAVYLRQGGNIFVLGAPR